MTTVTRTILPAVKGVRSTPFKSSERSQLVYSVDLMKAVKARRFFNHTPWTKIAQDLGITIEQAQKAFFKSKNLNVNLEWANVKPSLQYEILETIAPSPKAQRVSKARDYSTQTSVWSDDLVRWVLKASSVYCMTPTDIYKEIVFYSKVLKSDYPTITTIYSWIYGNTNRARKLKKELSTSIEAGSLDPSQDWESSELIAELSMIIKPDEKCKIVHAPKPKVDQVQLIAQSHLFQTPEIKQAAINYVLALMQAHQITLSDLN